MPQRPLRRETGKRALYLVLLPIAAGLSLLGGASQIAVRGDPAFYDLLLLSCGAVLLGCWGTFRRRWLEPRQLELVLAVAATLALTLLLWFALYRDPLPLRAGQVAVSGFLWFPLLVIFLFLAYSSTVALRSAFGVLLLVAAVTLPRTFGVGAPPPAVLAAAGAAGPGPLVPFQFFLSNALLIGAMHFFSGFQRRLQSMEATADAMRRLAHTDALTGLANRRHVEDVLEQELRRAGRYERPFSLLLIDIDDFKLLNDEHGHLAGDEVLVDLADRLASSVRASDRVGRWGGEEFVIVTPETRLEDAVKLAEVVRAHVAAAGVAGRAVTLSLGVASFRGGDGLQDLVARADAALYLAKRTGKNSVRSELEVLD